MSPRTRKKHDYQPPPDRNTFAKPRLPFQERAGPSFSGEHRQNSEQISGRKAVTKPDGLALGPACRSRAGYGNGNTNGKDLRIPTTAKTTTYLPCLLFSAFNSTSSNPKPEDENEDKDGGAELELEPEREPASIPSSTCTLLTPITHSDIGTDKYGSYDDSQFRPRGSSRSNNNNNCHDCQDYVHKQCGRSSRPSYQQRMQLLSDSEISVLDLGPSICVSGASRCAPEAEYGEKVQKDSVISTRSNSGSEIMMVLDGAAATIPITSTNSPRSTSLPTQEKTDHAYGREGWQTSTFTDQRIGECGHCGNNGGYRSSASGHALVAPETGDARMRRCRVDWAGDHECDCDFQCYDYDYGYGYGYGEDCSRVTPSALTNTIPTKTTLTSTIISSPILAPLKTTRKEPQPFFCWSRKGPIETEKNRL